MPTDLLTPEEIAEGHMLLTTLRNAQSWSAEEMALANFRSWLFSRADRLLSAAERVAELERQMAQARDALGKVSVMLGPNTLSGEGEFKPPWREKPWDSNATRLALWFDHWNDAQAVADLIRALKSATPPAGKGEGT